MANAVSTQVNSLRTALESPRAKHELMKALGDEMAVERMLRLTLTAASKSPELARCSVESIGLAMLTASQLGLEPDGRNAYLVAYKQQCQLLPSYMGLCMLACRNPAVESISGEAVFSNDVFEIEYGTKPSLCHIPNIADRGDFLGAWAVCRWTNGGAVFKFMTVDEIDKRRQAAQTDKVWSKWPHEMAVKTVIKRLTTTLPIGGEFAEALTHEATVVESHDDAPTKRRRVRGVTVEAFPEPTNGESERIEVQPDPRPRSKPEPGVLPAPPKVAVVDPATEEQLIQIDEMAEALRWTRMKVEAAAAGQGCRNMAEITGPQAKSLLATMHELAKLAQSRTDSDDGVDPPGVANALPAQPGVETKASSETLAAIQRLLDTCDMDHSESSDLRRRLDIPLGRSITEGQAEEIRQALREELNVRGARDDQKSAVRSVMSSRHLSHRTRLGIHHHV